MGGSRVDRARSSGLTSPVGGRALDAPLLSTDREGLAREACREQVEGGQLVGRQAGEVCLEQGPVAREVEPVRGARHRVDLAREAAHPSQRLEAEAKAADPGEDLCKREGRRRRCRQTAGGGWRPAQYSLVPPHAGEVDDRCARYKLS